MRDSAHEGFRVISSVMKNNLLRIYELAFSFLTPLRSQETYQKIVEEGMSLVKAEYGSLFLERNTNLERVFASTPELYHTKVRRRGFTYKAMIAEDPSLLSVDTVVNTIHPNIGRLGIKSTIFIPLQFEGGYRGVLSIDSQKSKRFTSRELELLKVFGSFASLAIRNAQLYEEVADALKLRDLFIHMASHELRTPLTAIRTYADLLVRKLKDPRLPESIFAKNLRAETIYLSRLIKELLQIDNIKSGTFDYKWKDVSVSEIIQRVVKNAKLSYPRRQVILANHIPEGKDVIVGDFDKLMQAVRNFVDNGIKYSPLTEPVTVNLAYGGQGIEITISDHGKGISSEDRRHIFEPFFKSDKSTKGFGIGLYIAKNIIEEHRGKISVHSKEGKGTTFMVQLPR